MNYAVVRRGVAFCLLGLAILGLLGCGSGGGGGTAATAARSVLQSVGWYYDNMPPDFFNNGSTCYLNLNLYLADAVSPADIDTFVIAPPVGGRWTIPASGTTAQTSSSGTTFIPLRLRFEPHKFPLGGVWTVSVQLKDGTVSTVQKTLHDPGSAADATYRYLYTAEDWAPPVADQSQYVSALQRFPAEGFSLLYSAADGGKITTTGFSAVRAAYLGAETRAYNMGCWLFDENKAYLGATTTAYTGSAHSPSGLIAGDGELSIVPAALSPGNAGAVDLSRVKYVRVVVLDGAQFAPQSAYENRSVSALIPVGIAAATSFQSALAKYTLSMPQIVRSGDTVPMTFTVSNTGSSDVEIVATPVRVFSNSLQLYSALNVITTGRVPVKPGETKAVTATWNGRDDAGNIVPPGSYAVVGSCMGGTENTDLKVDFTVQ